MSPEIQLVVDRLDSATGAVLADALGIELEVRYGSPDEPDGLLPDQLAPPHGTFLVAWRGDEAVGCGGFRRAKRKVGEIKRMYVAPSARRAGVARTVLTELEQTARTLGYTRLKLETGTKQPEAIELYLSTGYERIKPYGVYRRSPMSRCFAKNL